MITFIDDNRGSYGVEPICRVLPIAPAIGNIPPAEAEDQFYAAAGNIDMAA